MLSHKNVLKLIFPLVFLFTVQISSGQEKQIYYGYGVTQTIDHAILIAGRFETVTPYEYILIIGPIYSGSKEEIEKKIYDFFKKNGDFDKIRKASGSNYNFSFTSKIDTSLKKVIQFKKGTGIGSPEYELIKYEDDIGTASKLTTTKTYFTNLKLDDELYIDGSVNIKSKFVFYGYPHIVAEYQDLTITSVRYKAETYTSTDVYNKLLGLPYMPKDKPLIDAEFWVWALKIINAKPTRKEHYKVFNYPVKRLAAITDNFDNDEVDAYFKGFKNQEKSDSYFWENALLQNPKQSPMATYDLAPIKITKITGTLAQELKSKLEKYNYDKKYDFWGNKKEKADKQNKTKKEKKDDFWNN